MTLQEAIEEVKREYDDCACLVMDAVDIEDGPLTGHLEAIATILNAVVKGDLYHKHSQCVWMKDRNWEDEDDEDDEGPMFGRDGEC